LKTIDDAYWERFFGLFSGIVFFRGGSLLPDDLVIDLGNIRQWAVKQDMIWDPEAQFLSPERTQELFEKFSPRELQIAIEIYPDPDKPRKFFYEEYPYLSVRSLIKRGEKVDIIYWQMWPTQWDKDGNIITYGEVRFGFWYPGCGDEFCAISNSKRVTEKFYELLGKISNVYSVKTVKDWKKRMDTGELLEKELVEIEVDGDVKARFYREGQMYDVEFVVKNR